ncbi:MAG: hypothetical protein IKW22_07660 [Bacteroidaceae bacterium]|nr:hypothetical protein [Bacteroidaceae bacterium]
MSDKLYIAIIFTLLALTSCGGRKGELRIKGEIKGLNNADLTIFSRDGVIQGIDTLHVRQGKIDWKCPYDKDNGSLTIVYPTFSTLTVFGSSGDVIILEGESKQLNSTKVSGNEHNEAYTRLRLQIESAKAEEKDSLKKDFIKQHPESPVTRMLQLEELVSQESFSLKNGEEIPEFSLITRKGDTINNDSIKGKYALFAFWANWRGKTTQVNTWIRRLRRQARQPLVCISYNMDVNDNILGYIERTDTITWHSYCDQKAFLSDLPSQLGVRDLPLFVLTDTCSRIIAVGSNWNKDIEPTVKDELLVDNRESAEK